MVRFRYEVQAALEYINRGHAPDITKEFMRQLASLVHHKLVDEGDARLLKHVYNDNKRADQICEQYDWLEEYYYENYADRYLPSRRHRELARVRMAWRHRHLRNGRYKELRHQQSLF